jgi:hypothetical protein
LQHSPISLVGKQITQAENDNIDEQETPAQTNRETNTIA